MISPDPPRGHPPSCESEYMETRGLCPGPHVSDARAVTALAPHAAVLQQVLLATRWLARATNWLAWLFSTPSRKARIRSKASGIRQRWLSSQTVGSLQELLAGLDRAQQLETEPDAAVADEWRTSIPVSAGLA